MVFTAGNKGDTVRSDCWVSIELFESGGIKICLDSKVDALYGKSIKSLCDSTLNKLGVKNAKLTIEDKGALPFVIAARIEAAVRKATNTELYYLPERAVKPQASEALQQRFSRLYIPGNSPKLMINAAIYGSSGIILDLEDAVHHSKKDEARILVRNALRCLDFKGCERMVRINQLPLGIRDLEIIAPQKPNLVLVPKCEHAEQVLAVDNAISEILPHSEFPIHLMPIIESALGVQNAFDIAKASERVVALAIGLEDYTADIGVERTKGGQESFYARCSVLNAAKAAGIQAIDSVFSDVADMNALHENVKQSKALGFVGMGCIHPRQVSVINSAYAPSVTEIEKAKKVALAFYSAQLKGLSVTSLGSKMIDPPVVERAQQTIQLAIDTGLLQENWRDEYEH